MVRTVSSLVGPRTLRCPFRASSKSGRASAGRRWSSRSSPRPFTDPEGVLVVGAEDAPEGLQ